MGEFTEQLLASRLQQLSDGELEEELLRIGVSNAEIALLGRHERLTLLQDRTSDEQHDAGDSVAFAHKRQISKMSTAELKRAYEATLQMTFQNLASDANVHCFEHCRGRGGQPLGGKGD